MKSKLLLLLVILLLISGCRQNKDGPFTFIDEKGRKPTSWNEVLKLELSKGFGDTYIYGSSLSLFLTNLSDNEIRFPLGYNLRIFDYTGGLKEIKIREELMGPDFMTLPPTKQAGRPMGVVSFTPDIQADTNHKIRVFVIGEMLSDNPQKNKLVGAYMDIEMHPLNALDVPDAGG